VNGGELSELLREALAGLEDAREELRDLDAAIGDGDLGITVGDGSRAIREGLAELGQSPAPAEVLRVAAKRFANANPSTMSALVAAALLAAARTVGDRDGIDRALVLEVLDVAAATISARGGAQVGDKTILDALVPATEALRGTDLAGRGALAPMIAAAQEGVAGTTGLRSQRGRAAWVGERSIGHPDGGATACLRLLQALAEAWPDSATSAA